jgi:secreted PhoX family phosphatase
MIAVHPKTKEVYISLTNNNRRGSNPPSSNQPDGTTTAGSARPPVDEANPRANNVYGHIVRWRERGGDPAALAFSWDVFLFAGDPADPGGVGAAAVTNTVGYPGFEDETYHIFSAPDGLAFDPQGWLWIETDYSASLTGIQSNMELPHAARGRSDRTRRSLPHGTERLRDHGLDHDAGSQVAVRQYSAPRRGRRYDSVAFLDVARRLYAAPLVDDRHHQG